MGLNGANRGHMEQNGPKKGPNEDKMGHIGQNLLKDGDCPRNGDHPRDSSFN